MFCPVCNGIQSLHVRCSSCDSAIVDCGRSTDLTGPYSPYAQIEDEPLLSHASVRETLSCMHLVYCQTCKLTTEVSVMEW